VTATASVEQVAGAIAAGRPVAATVAGAQLRIDHPVPFLCVYRGRPGVDPAAAALARMQGSYLLTDRVTDEVRQLVAGVLEALADRFGSILVLEVWVVPGGGVRPRHDLLAASPEPPPVAELVAAALRRATPHGGRPVVEVVAGADVAPGDDDVLVDADQVRTLGCVHLGVAVSQPTQASGGLFPMALRSAQEAVGAAVRKALVQFAHATADVPPGDVVSLDPAALAGPVLDIDRRLAAIDGQLDFLLAVSPVNADEAWEEFRASSYARAPDFHYRPLPVDPDLVRRDLYALAIEDVDDPVVAGLLRDKRHELDHRARMLHDRDTPAFLLASTAQYGAIDDRLVGLARDALEQLAVDGRAGEAGTVLDAEQFAAAADAEMERYRQVCPDYDAQVVVRDDVPGVMVVRGDLLIGSTYQLPTARVDALIQHEVGTHTLTEFNGRSQPLLLLSVGLPGYEETQEGFAVLSEHIAGGLTVARMATLAARVLASRCVEDGATFVETFRLLLDEVGLSPWRAYDVTMRVYRGGGWTKDAMYLRGLDGVLQHLGGGGRIEPLLVGKPALSYVPVVEELLWRAVLQPPRLRPRWLDDPGTAARLDAVRAGMTVVEVAAACR